MLRFEDSLGDRIHCIDLLSFPHQHPSDTRQQALAADFCNGEDMPYLS
jgi:hypothetical protein